jgi:hypothetical protein
MQEDQTVSEMAEEALRGCLRRVDVGDQGLLQSSQNGKMTAETLLYSPGKADFGGLLGLFRHPLESARELRLWRILSAYGH